MRGQRSVGSTSGSMTRVPRVNLLPAAYRPAPLITFRNVLLLVIVVELVIALYIAEAHRETATSGVRQFFQNLRGEQPIAETRLGNLRGQVANLETELEQRRAGRQALNDRKKDVPSLISSLFAAAPEGVAISGVRQAENTALVNGLAGNLEQVNAYRVGLLNTGVVTSASVSSVAQERATGKTAFGLTVGLR